MELLVFSFDAEVPLLAPQLLETQQLPASGSLSRASARTQRHAKDLPLAASSISKLIPAECLFLQYA